MPHWSQSDHPPSCQGQTTDHRPCAVGRPYWRWSIGSLEIWVLSFSLWDPRTPAGAEKGISCFMEPMGQGAKAWGRGLGKGNVVSVCEKFPFSGKMGKIQSYKGARDLHRSQRRIEERRHGPHIPELSQSSERPVSSSLAMGCPTPNQPCQERSYQPPPPSSPLRQVLASAGMRQTPSGVPLVSQQHPPPPPPRAPSLWAACCWGLLLWPGSDTLLEAGLQSEPLGQAHLSFPWGALGAWDTFQGWLGTNLLLGVPGDQNSLLSLFPRRC